MTPTIALRAAGGDAHLVARPHGAVVHVSLAALSPSGRFIPRGSRTVCCAYTRRLSIIDGSPDRRLCARCSVRLSLALTSPKGRRATPQLTRVQLRNRFDGLTLGQLANDLEHATSETELDQVVHMALLLHGSRRLVEIADQVRRHRARVHIATAAEDLAAGEVREHREAANARREADRKESHKLRGARIGRLGIRNARPSRGAPLR